MQTLPSFRKTRTGYESESRDGKHLYLITFNLIDYDVTHYWAQNPNGELIAPRTTTPIRAARKHYALLQPKSKV